MKLNLVGGAYTLDDIAIDVQTCINWYAQSAENGGGQNVLIPTSGLLKRFELNNPICAMKMLSNGIVLIVTAQIV